MPARHGENWQPGPGSRVDLQHPWGQGCFLGLYAQTAAGAVWPDLAGQGNTVSLIAGPVPAAGPSVRFDGSDDYATYPSLLLNGRATFSMMARVAYDANSNNSLYHERFDATHQLYWLYSDVGRWYLNVNGTNYTPLIGGFVLTPGQCYTVGFSYNAGTIRFFIDGGFRSEVTGAPASINTAGGTVIQTWRTPSGPQPAGNLSWMAMWDRVLPDAYFAEIINRPYEMIWTPGRRRMFWMGAAAGTLYTKTLTETVGAADTQLHDTARLLNETVTTSDVLVKSIGRLLSETVATTDVLQRSVARTLAETVTTTDVLQRSVARALAETVTTTDVLQRSVARALAETLTGSDAAITFDVSRTLTDSVALTDAITRLLSRALTETITAADDLEAHIVAVSVYYKTLTEIITATDTVTRQKALILAVTLARKILDALLTRDALDAEFTRDILDLWGGND